jgi:hypothetical protein
MGLKHAIVLAITLVSCGCMQLKAVPHMDELLRIKDYSDEKDAQAKWIEGEVNTFERLLTSVRNGSIKSYPDHNAVAAEFGKPVLAEEVQDAGQTVSRWLYRHPIQKLATDRVYLYFDAGGQLVKSEHIPSPSQ